MIAVAHGPRSALGAAGAAQTRASASLWPTQDRPRCAARTSKGRQGPTSTVRGQRVRPFFFSRAPGTLRPRVREAALGRVTCRIHCHSSMRAGDAVSRSSRRPHSPKTWPASRDPPVRSIKKPAASSCEPGVRCAGAHRGDEIQINQAGVRTVTGPGALSIAHLDVACVSKDRRVRERRRRVHRLGVVGG